MSLPVWKIGSAVCQSAKRYCQGLRAQRSHLHSRRRLSKEEKRENPCAQSPLSPWPYNSLAPVGTPKDTMGVLLSPGLGREQAGEQGWEEAGHVTAKLNVNFGC